MSTSLLVALESLTDFDATGEELLFDTVDPDALDRLFARTADSARSEGWVTFPLAGYQVAVSAEGEIVIQESSRSSK